MIGCGQVLCFMKALKIFNYLFDHLASFMGLLLFSSGRNECLGAAALEPP